MDHPGAAWSLSISLENLRKNPQVRTLSNTLLTAGQPEGLLRGFSLLLAKSI